MDIRGVSCLYLFDLDLVGDAPLPTNSSGNNLLHLVVTPSGSLSAYYLWTSYFDVPREFRKSGCKE